MEETDPGPQQALSTAEASRPQQVTHAALPMVLGQFVELLLHRFDVKARREPGVLRGFDQAERNPRAGERRR